jgi:hypothetical protein
MNLGHLIQQAAHAVAHAASSVVPTVQQVLTNPIVKGDAEIMKDTAGLRPGGVYGRPLTPHEQQLLAPVGDPQSDAQWHQHDAENQQMLGQQMHDQFEQQRRQAALQALTVNNINTAALGDDRPSPQATVQTLNGLYQLMYGSQYQ